MADPTTRFGRWLLNEPWAHSTACEYVMPGDSCDCKLPDAIAAIEAEARQQEREALAERIEAVFDRYGHMSECAFIRYPGNHFEPPDPCTCGGEAVLSILRETEPKEANRG